jgi:hypothetical protein
MHGDGFMPIYNPDGPEFSERVHENGRTEDSDFPPTEALYRRYRENDLVDGKPTPLSAFRFDNNSGHSVNRSKYSEPQDVLEPDCCNGSVRIGYVVLELAVNDIPAAITSADETGRVYRFHMKHVPRATCFAHSEIWCNQQGSVREPYEKPPKNVRDVFAAELIRRIRNPPHKFEPRGEAYPST